MDVEGGRVDEWMGELGGVVGGRNRWVGCCMWGMDACMVAGMEGQG